MTNGAILTVTPLLSELSAADCRHEMRTRQRQLELELGAAAMSVLLHSERVVAWIRIDDALHPVSAQHEHKPKGGRPQGGVAEAARRLPLPGNQSRSARRQLITRAIKIASIQPGAKTVAAAEGLDNNQTALLAIASETTEDAQIEIARTWKSRNRVHRSPVDNKETYTVSGLEHLDATERRRLDRLMDALAARMPLVIAHSGSTDREPSD